MATGSLDKSIYVWEIMTGRLVEHLRGHKDTVYSVTFSPNAVNLMSGSHDRTIKMRELSYYAPGAISSSVENGKCLETLEGHSDYMLSVALTPDGNWLLSGAKDNGLRFLDARTGVTQFTLHGHKNSIISVARSPQGIYFATGSGDMKACIWSCQLV